MGYEFVPLIFDLLARGGHRRRDPRRRHRGGERRGHQDPTAVTREVWELYVALSPAAAEAGNDEAGRLWDILWMLRCAAKNNASDELEFQLYVVTTETDAVARHVEGHVRAGRRRCARHHHPAPRAGLKETA